MPDHHDPARPAIDQTVPQIGNRHGDADSYSGHGPGSFRSPTPDEVDAGATRGGMPADRGDGAGAGQDATALSRDAGHRATVDQHTGEVHGSGAGAGGGRPGEDLDDDDAGGSRYDRRSSAE